MTPFFFVGNVRSGTSLMVRLLNKHPEVYASHESDVCWILYQYFTHGCLKDKSFGGQKALNFTMKHCKKYIDLNKSVRENYEKMQTKLMRKGSLWLAPMKKKPKYIGDKTPNNFVVYDDYTSFVRESFSDAVYLHIVRHPRDFVASVLNRHREHSVFGATPGEILAWWVMAERKVIEMKASLDITTIRYKDIGGKTSETMNALFWHWDLPQIKLPNEFVKVHDYSLKLTQNATEIVERYSL